MNKNIFGIKELLVLLALLGMASLIVLRFLNPHFSSVEFLNNRLVYFSLGLLFGCSTVIQIISSISNNESGINRISGFIRVPLYFIACVYCFYVASYSSVSA